MLSGFLVIMNGRTGSTSGSAGIMATLATGIATGSRQGIRTITMVTITSQVIGLTKKQWSYLLEPTSLKVPTLSSISNPNPRQFS